MLDLNKLNKKLEEALSKETVESLQSWLLYVKLRELFSVNIPFKIKELIWQGSSYESNSDVFILNELTNPAETLGNDRIEGVLKWHLCQDTANLNPDEGTKENLINKNMTPNFTESFFLYKLAL
jgi:hypothetical protein